MLWCFSVNYQHQHCDNIHAMSNWMLYNIVCVNGWQKCCHLPPRCHSFTIGCVRFSKCLRHDNYQYKTWARLEKSIRNNEHTIKRCTKLALCSTPQTPPLDPPLINCFKWSNSNLHSICLFHFLLQSKFIHYGNIGSISS